MKEWQMAGCGGNLEVILVEDLVTNGPQTTEYKDFSIKYHRPKFSSPLNAFFSVCCCAHLVTEFVATSALRPRVVAIQVIRTQPKMLLVAI